VFDIRPRHLRQWKKKFYKIGTSSAVTKAEVPEIGAEAGDGVDKLHGLEVVFPQTLWRIQHLHQNKMDRFI